MFVLYRLFFLFLSCVALLPYPILMKLGRWIGQMLYYFMKRRRKVTQINIQKCFPEKKNQEVNDLVQSCFRSLGMAGIESIIAWFMSERRFKKIPYTFHNIHLLDACIEAPSSVILYGNHMHCLEMIGRVFGNNRQYSLLYQKNKHPFFESLQTDARSRYADCIDRKDTKSLIHKLRRDSIVLWYAPDQNFGNEANVFAPFFGHSCATLQAITRLPRLGKSQTLFTHYYRRSNDAGYDIYFDQVEGEMTEVKYNAYLEACIRKHPEQYLWQHKRFKTQPEGFGSFYQHSL